MEECIDRTPRRESKKWTRANDCKTRCFCSRARDRAGVWIEGALPGPGGGRENARWVITSAWLTAIHLLSRDKSPLSLVRPGLKYFCSDKVQKEIVKISTCRSELNFCPHATEALSRGYNLCQGGDVPPGRGRGSGGAESRGKFREAEV